MSLDVYSVTLNDFVRLDLSENWFYVLDKHGIVKCESFQLIDSKVIYPGRPKTQRIELRDRTHQLSEISQTKDQFC